MLKMVDKRLFEFKERFVKENTKFSLRLISTRSEHMKCYCTRGEHIIRSWIYCTDPYERAITDCFRQLQKINNK